MKVLKLGYLRNIKCPKCDSLLQYDLKKDIKTHYLKAFSIKGEERTYYYIICPICNKEISIVDDFYQWEEDKRKYEI